MESKNFFSNQHRGKGVIAGLTGLLGLYFSAAMWVEFNDALGGLLGFFSNKINKRKNIQIAISKNKGDTKNNFFIFLG